MSDSNLTTPRVAVLLAAYNGMQWIEQQLNSIFQQHGVSSMIFISVDRSTDDTLVFCEELALKHPSVVVL